MREIISVRQCSYSSIDSQTKMPGSRCEQPGIITRYSAAAIDCAIDRRSADRTVSFPDGPRTGVVKLRVSGPQVMRANASQLAPSQMAPSSSLTARTG